MSAVAFSSADRERLASILRDLGERPDLWHHAVLFRRAIAYLSGQSAACSECGHLAHPPRQCAACKCLWGLPDALSPQTPPHTEGE